jgi:adenylate cyclase
MSPTYHCDLSVNCLVCGLPLAGAAGKILGWFGIGRSSRNPNCCTRCNTHIEEGRLVEITVLFADLSSFTEMTQKLGASPTYDIIDEYLRLASETLSRHGAFIDKYIGDAVMAFFNVPVKREDHAAAAVAAAAELQRRLPELAARLGVPLHAAVGIASGFARVGRLGSDDIKDFTAIGDAVNLAARLEAKAGAGEIIVSRDVYEKVSAQYPGVPSEALSLKGYGQPVAAYRLSRGAEGGPARSERAAPVAQRAMSWAALALAVLGAGCLSTGLASLLGLVFGAAHLASFLALMEITDRTPARVPILFAAGAMAAANLVFLRRNPHLGERARRALAVLAASVLGLVAIEIVYHFHNDRIFW